MHTQLRTHAYIHTHRDNPSDTTTTTHIHTHTSMQTHVTHTTNVHAHTQSLWHTQSRTHHLHTHTHTSASAKIAGLRHQTRWRNRWGQCVLVQVSLVLAHRKVLEGCAVALRRWGVPVHLDCLSVLLSVCSGIRRRWCVLLGTATPISPSHWSQPKPTSTPKVKCVSDEGCPHTWTVSQYHCVFVV